MNNPELKKQRLQMMTDLFDPLIEQWHDRLTTHAQSYLSVADMIMLTTAIAKVAYEMCEDEEDASEPTP